VCRHPPATSKCGDAVKRKLFDHLLSIVVVGGVFGFLIVRIQADEAARRPPVNPAVEEALGLSFLDFGDPLDQALFRESLDAFAPDDSARHRALLQEILDARRRRFTEEMYKTGAEERGVTAAKMARLAEMYVQFMLIYLVVMIVTIYAAETLGVYRFVQWKQGKRAFLARLFDVVQDRNRSVLQKAVRVIALLTVAIAKGLVAMMLFSPAYVIAYSLKTRFDTDSVPFMIALGVVSNGLLASYAHKFFTFLVAESRKGYVETAMVKNLHHSYAIGSQDGIALRAIMRWRKAFPGHVFQHIYLNARHQFVPTFKEHASFVITGLVIIEMALNIQGHLNYEMLKNILTKQYDVVLVIVFAIYLLVKATEVVVDVMVVRSARRIGGRGEP
jgi:hypothetical protein